MDDGLSPVPRRGKEKLQVPEGIGLELAPLLDPDFVTAALAESCADSPVTIESCQVRHLRFHPGKDSLVAYDVEISSADEDQRETISVFVRCESQNTFGRELRRAKAAAIHPGKVIEDLLVLHDQRAIFIEFPNDSRLPNLSLLRSGEQLSELLERHLGCVVVGQWQFAAEKLKSTVLKYKPERRLVCRCDTFWIAPGLSDPLALSVVLRFERRGMARKVEARARRLHEALSSSDRLRSPRLLFAEPSCEVVAMECISGRSLADEIQGDDPIGAVERAADDLATLHRCGAFDRDDPDTQARLRSSDASVELLGYCQQPFSSKAKKIHERLERLLAKAPPGIQGTVHGDFHQEQILIDDNCDWIVDVEWAGYGDTSLDLGSFLGQLSMLEIRKLIPAAAPLQQAFLERHQHHCGATDRARLACEEIHSLLELAGKQFRRLKSAWPKRVGKILARCEHILDEQQV